MSSDEQQSTNDEALIEVVAVIVRAAGETQDERIADIALLAVEKLKETPGVFERMLLKCTEPAPQQQYQNPMLASAVNRFSQ